MAAYSFEAVSMFAGRLDVPAYEGISVPLGANAANELTRLSSQMWPDDLLVRGPISHVVDFLKRTPLAYEQYHAGGALHELEGILTRYRTYAALIPGDHEPGSFAVLRVALIAHLVTGAKPVPDIQIQGLCWMLTTPVKVSVEAKAAVDRLATAFHAGNVVNAEILFGVAVAIERHGLTAAITLLSEVTSTRRASSGRQRHAPTMRRVSLLEIHGVELDPGELEDDLVEQRSIDFVDLAEPEDEKAETPTEPPSASQCQSTLAASEGDLLRLELHRAKSRSRLRLHGPLIPGTDRSLSCSETRDAIRNLVSNALAAEPDVSFGALVLLLVCIVGSTAEQVERALVAFFLGETSVPDGVSFRIVDKGVVRFPPFKAPVAPLGSPLYAPCEQLLLLPFPRWVAEFLQQARQNGRYRHLLSRGLKKSHEATLAASALASAVVQRVSLERLQNTLSVQMFARHDDLPAVQWIVGDQMGHGAGQLSYYETTEARLQDIFREALTEMWPDRAPDFEPRDPAAASVRIGAPRACFDREQVCRAIVALRCAYQMAAARQHTIQGKIEAHNRLALWTLAMFIAATSHRATKYLVEFTRRNFLLGWLCEGDAGVAIIRDKLTDHGLSWRAAVLTRAVCEQLVVYIRSAERLRKALRSLPATQRRKYVGAVAGLDEMLGGASSFFQLIQTSTDRGAATVPITRCLLAEHWPEWGQGEQSNTSTGAINTLRHRLAHLSQAAGITGEDRRRLMGHAALIPLASAGDLDDFVSLVGRTAPALEKVLGDEGWARVGGTSRISTRELKATNLSALPVDKIEDLRDCEIREARRRLIHILKLPRIARTTLRRETLERTTAVLTELGLVIDGIPIQRCSLPEGWSAELLQRVTGHIRHVEDGYFACLTIRKQLRHFIQEYEWEVSLPSLPYRREGVLPEITTASLEALRWQLQLDRGVRRQLGAGASDDASRVAFAGIFLGLHGGLLNFGSIISAIHHAPSAVHVAGSDSVAVSIHRSRPPTLASARPMRLETGVSVSGLAAVAIQGLSRATPRANRRDVLLRAWDLVCASGAVVQQPLKIEVRRRRSRVAMLRQSLRVVGLARQLTQCGARSAWERGRLRTRGLPPSRLKDVVQTARTMAVPAGEARLLLGRRACHSVRSPCETTPAISYIRKLTGAVWRASRPHGIDLQHWLDHPPTTWGQRHDLCNALTAIVQDRVRDAAHLESRRKRAALASLHQYLTLIAGPLLAQLGDRHWFDLSDGEATRAVHEALATKSASTSARSLLMFRRLAAKTVELGGPTIDIDEVCEDLDLETQEAGPYLWDEGEIAAVAQRLEVWRAASTTALRSSDQPHARQIEAAEVALMLSHALGLRRGEVEALRFVDIAQHDGNWLLFVRPTRHHRPKSENAIRHFELREWLPEQEVGMLVEFVEGQRARYGNEPPPREARILDVTWLPDGSLPDYGPADVVTAACKGIVDASAVRFHAGRHTFANRLLRAVMQPDSAWAHGVSLPIKADVLNRGPLAFRCIALSRALGHGHPRTTLENYIHLVAHLPESARGLDPVTVEETAQLSGISETTLRDRAQSAGIVLTTGFVSTMLLAMSAPSVAVVEAVDKNDGPLPSTQSGRPRVSLVAFAELVHEIAQQRLTDREIELRRGMRNGEVGVLRSLIGGVARRHRYNLLHDSDAADDDLYVRVPRIGHARSILGRLERLEAERPKLVDALRVAIEVQPRFDGTLWAAIPSCHSVLRSTIDAITPKGWTVVEHCVGSVNRLTWTRSRSKRGEGRQESTMNFVLLVISASAVAQRFRHLHSEDQD